MMQAPGTARVIAAENPTPSRPRIGRPPLRDRATMREAILGAALREFQRSGYEGASVNAIATRSRVNKRMLYLYFGSKLGLYRAVLQRGYAELRRAEMQVSTADQPCVVISRIIATVSAWCARNRKMVCLFGDDGDAFAEWCNEDSPAVAKLAEVLARGEAQGVFHAGAKAADLYLTIVSYAAASKVVAGGGQRYLETMILAYLASPQPEYAWRQSSPAVQ